ncbi:MAG: hypothetical protein V2I40_05580 [Desulfobacteraceae bacterium]|jgi:hypothetical protein|nr:hypothetical protein [Desulfobacteraceae bacterium]
MVSNLSSIPWPTPALWQEANTCLARTLRQHQSVLAESYQQVQRIRRRLESIFPLMDRLCRSTCPDCMEVCCRRAWVWADFKDLLFLHLAGIPVPDGQLLGRQGDHCRYKSPDGCRLDRVQRPFVCTWYLCPRQTQCLREEPVKMQIIQERLLQIKNLRQTMEMSFIRAVTLP